MVISSFISSVLVLVLGIWAYMKLESSMNMFAEKQLLIEPSKFSYKMWKDMPVTMYQSFTFFNLTNWNQVKSIGQKPRFVEVGPYVYRTLWTKSDVNFMDEDRLVSFSERKQWMFQPHLSKGSEEDLIWTINTPLMTALALIQNAPVITRNIVSVILDGLGEGAFIKRNIRSLLFEGYSDLIVSVGPLFDRRFANFNGKFAYLYNKNDSVDGLWTVWTGTEDMSALNKIVRFQSNIVNMTTQASGQQPQGLNEVKPECAAAWSLDQASNGQLFAPFNRDVELAKLEQELKVRRSIKPGVSAPGRPNNEALAAAHSAPPQTGSKRFFSRSAHSEPAHHQNAFSQENLVPNPFIKHKTLDSISAQQIAASISAQEKIRDIGKFIFYPDLCRPIHLLASKSEVTAINGIQASRYYIDPRVFMNSSQVPSNRCYEMNPRPALANTLAATINSVTGANVAMPNLVGGASSPFAMFSPQNNHHHHHHNQHNENPASGLFERSNLPGTLLNNALHSLGASTSANSQQDQLASSSNQAPVSRLGRVRQLFSNIVSQRMSAGPGYLLPSLAAGPASMLLGNHFPGSSNARNSPDEPAHSSVGKQLPVGHLDARNSHANLEALQQSGAQAPPVVHPPGGSDRWITQFRFKWPRGVFSIGQCQLGAPIYASLPHFLDADEYFLEQVDGLKPNRSLHEFYIDIESTLHSIPVGAKARLQLNVATPELRFRNIPNAMIPVLWQEVTFEIDKPIATMLYWSFTMSPTLYKLVSYVLLLGGLAGLIASLLGGIKQHKRRGQVMALPQPTSNSSENSFSVGQGRPTESRQSSWTPPADATRGAHLSSEALEKIRYGTALNRAFRSSSSELHQDEHQRRPKGGRQDCAGGNMDDTTLSASPKQPSSRASSHCELVSSLGATVNCAGCLLACLRHSPNTTSGQAQIHEHLQVAATHKLARGCGSDSSLVRQETPMMVSPSDSDKAVSLSTSMSSASPRESHLDSCSSIYTQRDRSSTTFK